MKGLCVSSGSVSLVLYRADAVATGRVTEPRLQERM